MARQGRDAVRIDCRAAARARDRLRTGFVLHDAASILRRACNDFGSYLACSTIWGPTLSDPGLLLVCPRNPSACATSVRTHLPAYNDSRRSRLRRAARADDLIEPRPEHALRIRRKIAAKPAGIWSCMLSA